MSIKLIATDLDGTLLQKDHVSIGAENLEALQLAAAQGIYIVLASGRTKSVLAQTLRQAEGLVTHALIANGAAVLDLAAATVLFETTIPYDCWVALYAIIRKHGGVCELYCERNSYMEREELCRYESPNLPAAFVAELKSYILPVDNLPQALAGKSIEKINVLTTPKDRFASLYRELAALGTVSLTSSLPGNLEINARGVNKGTALRRLCRRLDISAEQVLAVGDAENDLEMLAWAGYSFAVENGAEEAKRAARFRTAANHEGGVGKAVRRCLAERPSKA